MKYILNTTFHIHSSLMEEVLGWIETEFIGNASNLGGFSSPQIARVLGSAEENYESVAVQISIYDLTAGERWLAGNGYDLFALLSGKYGDKVLFFSTWLEVIK